jgi:hypothetical protein
MRAQPERAESRYRDRVETDWGNVIVQGFIGLVAVAALIVSIRAIVIAKNAPKVQRRVDLRASIRELLDSALVELEAARKAATSGKIPSDDVAAVSSAAEELRRLETRDHELQGLGTLSILLGLYKSELGAFDTYKVQIDALSTIASADAQTHVENIKRKRDADVIKWPDKVNTLTASIQKTLDAITKLDG